MTHGRWSWGWQDAIIVWATALIVVAWAAAYLRLA